jgi:hypothetical protein
MNIDRSQRGASSSSKHPTLARQVAGVRYDFLHALSVCIYWTWFDVRNGKCLHASRRVMAGSGGTAAVANLPTLDGRGFCCVLQAITYSKRKAWSLGRSSSQSCSLNSSAPQSLPWRPQEGFDFKSLRWNLELWPGVEGQAPSIQSRTIASTAGSEKKRARTSSGRSWEVLRTQVL